MRDTKKILLVAVLLVLIGLAVVFRRHIRIDLLLEQIRALGPWGPLAYIFLYLIAPSLGMPGFPLTIAAGALFGPVWGTLYSLVGATGGASLAFFIARYLASDWVEQRTKGIAKRLKEAVEQEGCRFVAFTRLVPLFPFELLNYAFGLTKIKPSHYIVTSFFAMLPGTAAYSFIGYAGRESAVAVRTLCSKSLRHWGCWSSSPCCPNSSESGEGTKHEPGLSLWALPCLLSGGPTMNTPVAPFSHLSTLWVQVTGTWCNLQCVHCINASGPKHPWLKSLAAETVKRSIKEAEHLGVKEIYFTGGEPFLHKDILKLLAFSLQVAPTTVLTNGTMINPKMADALAALARASPYSLEIRVSVDDISAARNDRIRGRGSLAKAVRAIQLLYAKGLLPILTATEILHDVLPAGIGMYERFRNFLLSLGIEKPRVKIIPVFPIGRMAREGGPLLTEEMLQGFDVSLLQCSETRVVADGGIYSCPILAGLKEARLSEGSLQQSFKPCRLYHSACVTCYQTGMTCKNF